MRSYSDVPPVRAAVAVHMTSACTAGGGTLQHVLVQRQDFGGAQEDMHKAQSMEASHTCWPLFAKCRKCAWHPPGLLKAGGPSQTFAS